MHQYGLSAQLLQIGLPCAFIEAGSNNELSSKYGIDSVGIAEKVILRWSNQS